MDKIYSIKINADGAAIYNQFLKPMLQNTFFSLKSLEHHRTYFWTMDLKYMPIKHIPMVESLLGMAWHNNKLLKIGFIY